MTDKDWYLFRYSIRAEKRVKRRVKHVEQVDALFPLAVAWRKCGRDRKKREVPVRGFPGYLILGVSTDEVLPFHAILKLDTTVRPVWMTAPEGKALGRLPRWAIEKMRDNERMSDRRLRRAIAEAEPDPKYTEGEVVRILGGAMGGLEGAILRVNPDRREVKIEIDGPFEGATVHYADVERMNDAA